MGSIKNWGNAASLKPENFPQPQVSKNIEPFPKKLYEDSAFLHEKYVVERLSIKEISRLTFSSRWLVRKHLRTAGIELRDQKQQGKTRSQLGFGESWRRHRITTNNHEIAVITKMQKLRERGWSYLKIAEVLNDWRIKTKKGRSKWHARSVQQILERAIK